MPWYGIQASATLPHSKHAPHPCVYEFPMIHKRLCNASSHPCISSAIMPLPPGHHQVLFLRLDCCSQLLLLQESLRTCTYTGTVSVFAPPVRSPWAVSTGFFIIPAVEGEEGDRGLQKPCSPADMPDPHPDSAGEPQLGLFTRGARDSWAALTSLLWHLLHTGSELPSVVSHVPAVHDLQKEQGSNQPGKPP